MAHLHPLGVKNEKDKSEPDSNSREFLFKQPSPSTSFKKLPVLPNLFYEKSGENFKPNYPLSYTATLVEVRNANELLQFGADVASNANDDVTKIPVNSFNRYSILVREII